MTLRHRLLELVVMHRCWEVVDEIHLSAATHAGLEELLDKLGLGTLKARIVSYHCVERDGTPTEQCIPEPGVCHCHALATPTGLCLIGWPPSPGQAGYADPADVPEPACVVSVSAVELLVLLRRSQHEVIAWPHEPGVWQAVA